MESAMFGIWMELCIWFQTLHSDQHWRIVDAIESHDPVAARAFMTEHLETIMTAMSVDG